MVCRLDRISMVIKIEHRIGAYSKQQNAELLCLLFLYKFERRKEYIVRLHPYFYVFVNTQFLLHLCLVSTLFFMFYSLQIKD